ncbi:hypothetical protein [Pseudoflavonifractor sp. 524-17]|nr:hypothetical protein [Pseudoflavonifractor sp. 524-17]
MVNPCAPAACARLSWLKDAGRLEAVFEDNMLLWRRGIAVGHM